MENWQNLSIIIGVVLIFLVFVLAFLYRQMLTQIKNEDPTYWEKEIAAIENRYEGNYPQEVIIFYGSSSIRKWENLEKDMAPFQVVNHGFGGSKTADATYYVNRMVFPFKPRAIVIFTGTNDINGVSGNSKSGEEVFNRTVELFNALHDEIPDLPIFYISISPNKARWRVWEDADAANQLISAYAANHANITFIDTTEALLNSQGEPDKDLFVFDGLHLNKNGYALWTSIIKPILTAELKAP